LIKIVAGVSKQVKLHREQSVQGLNILLKHIDTTKASAGETDVKKHQAWKTSIGDNINSCYYKLMDVTSHLRSTPSVGLYIAYAWGHDWNNEKQWYFLTACW